jgi:hypothetical protein
MWETASMRIAFAMTSAMISNNGMYGWSIDEAPIREKIHVQAGNLMFAKDER